MPKLRNVSSPYLSFDGYTMFKDLLEKSGVDASQVTLTGGYRTKSYNDSLPKSVPNSRHIHGDALDFGGKLEDGENQKLFTWLNSDAGKEWQTEWGTKFIGGYGDDHIHLGVKDGAGDKSDRVKKLYNNESKWNANIGSNGMIDITKVSDAQWKDPYDEPYLEPKNRSKVTTDGKDVNLGDPVPKQQDWKNLDEDKRREVLDKYKEVDKKLSEAETQEEKDAIKKENADIFKYGKEALRDYYTEKKQELIEEQRTKYGLNEVYENNDKIKELERQKQKFTEGVEDDEIKAINEEIQGYKDANGQIIMKADFDRKTDNLKQLAEKAEAGTLTKEEKEQYDGLKKQLPTEAQRKKIYDNLAEEVHLGTNEEKLNGFIDGVGKEGMHPYLVQTTRPEFQDAYQAKYKEDWLFENKGKSGTNLEAEGNALRAWGEDTWNNLLNPMNPSGMLLRMMGANPIDVSNREQGLTDMQDGKVTFDRFMWEEGMLDEWVEKQAEIKGSFDNSTINEIETLVPWEVNFGPEDYPKGTEGDDHQQEEEDPGKGGNDFGNDPAKRKEYENKGLGTTHDRFKYDPEAQGVFDKIGGADGAMAIAQMAMGFADASDPKVPEQEEIDPMYINHMMTIKRLSEIGMPLVEQAQAREALDESFKMAKAAMEDASNGNRGQLLSSISSLSANRQRGALDIEAKKSAMRREYMSEYGSMLKYVNDFQTTQGNIAGTRQFEVSKMKSKAAGEALGTGLDQLVKSISNAKEHGPGSVYDMYQQYMKHQVLGAEAVEGEFQEHLKTQAGVETKEAETNKPIQSAAAVATDPKTAGRVQADMESAEAYANRFKSGIDPITQTRADSQTDEFTGDYLKTLESKEEVTLSEEDLINTIQNIRI